MPTDVALERPGTREVDTLTVQESPVEVGQALRVAPGGLLVLTRTTGEAVEIERRRVMWYRAVV
jgi:hypothetical protein